MEVLKEKCGQDLPGTLVTGEITARKVSVFNFIKMVTNTKECGLWIRNMVKVPIGETILASWEENIPETGLKTRSMEEVPSSSRTVIDTMDIGWMECLREREEWFIKMVTSMKDNGTKEKETDMVFWQREMVIISKDIGSMTNVKAKDHTSTVTKTNFSSVNGLMTNQKLASTLKLKMRMPILDLRDHIFRIHMFCHKFQSSNYLIQPDSLKKQWKELSE